MTEDRIHNDRLLAGYVEHTSGMPQLLTRIVHSTLEGSGQCLSKTFICTVLEKPQYSAFFLCCPLGIVVILSTI